MILLNEGEAVEDCPIPEPLLTLCVEGDLTGDGDGCDLLVDLLVDLPLGWSVLFSVSGFISTTSSSASSAVLSSVTWFSSTTSLTSSSSSIRRFTGSRSS